MRKALVSMLLATAALVLMGMGDLGGEPEGKVPETSDNVKVRLVDREGAVHQLEQFSMEGKLYLVGQVGSGTLTIPFDKLKKVSFGKVVGDHVSGTVLLKGGELVALNIRRRSLFYGSLGFGAFQIRVADVSEIEFSSP